ncbi:MAG: BrnT family toxin [Sphingomonadaceae bacterium]|nr:BrnT family toxin [Sphingomonadaceae bacterium]
MVEFDPMKDEQNQSKHGLPLELAPLVFEGPFIEEEDRREDYGETRIVATGPIAPLGDRLCVVVYTWRDAQRRIISFRKANDREVRKYQASIA